MSWKNVAALGWSLGLLAIGWTGAAVGQEPLVSDRPDFTESAATVAPGRVQLEGGWTFARVDELETHTLGETLARIGLIRHGELRLGLNSWADVDGPGDFADSGIQDLHLGAKFLLLETAGARPAAALLLGSSLPTGSDGIGAEHPDPEVILALAWGLTDILSLGANLGHAWPHGDDDRFAQSWGSVSLGMAATGRIGLFLEWLGFDREEADGPGHAWMDAGLTCRLNDDLQVDARYGKGLSGRDPDYYLGVGLAVRR
jgi:hypothetical protein